MAGSSPGNDQDAGKPSAQADLLRQMGERGAQSRVAPSLFALLGIPDSPRLFPAERAPLDPAAVRAAHRLAYGPRYAEPTAPEQRALQQEILDLRSKLERKAQEAATAAASAEEQRSRLEEWQSAYAEVIQKQDLSYLLDRVGEPARRALLAGNSLRSFFETRQPCDAFVMSIDVRRSTELMLKAREPRLFADFTTSLCDTLSQIILDNFGVFDKFTGDGILAFFPVFYSGPDAGYRAVKAADECHAAFFEHYRSSRRCFVSVLRDAGLGIGIDYGQAQIVRIRGDLTVVGTPVVYACRMGGASAGHTLLNQPAYEEIFEKFSAYCNFAETDIIFKHEGPTLAYQVALNGKPYRPGEPSWLAANPAEANPQSTEDVKETNE